MASILDYCTEGPRTFISSWKQRIFPKHYPGTAEEICKKIVKECWNRRYFQTSTGNFTQFWTRDFGWCAASLVKLGYTKEVHQTIRYALNRFKDVGKITTTISTSSRPFDFPTTAVDSLPWLIHSIKVSKFPYHDWRSFLNSQIINFSKTIVNEQTGLVEPTTHFSSIKDLAIRKSSCYDNSMVGLLATDLKSMKLDNPFKSFDYTELITRHFWNGEYFYDDLSQENYVAADANLFPYLFGLITDEHMLKSSVQAIRNAHLDVPFPLRYTQSREKISFVWQESFLRDYEGSAVWTHMGLLFVKLVKKVDEQLYQEYKQKYTQVIEQQRNFREVFTKDGKPFSTPFYYSDSGMLWAANYLTL